MAEQPNNITFVTTDSESEENAFELGIKDLFNLSVARWWWFVISITISLSLGMYKVLSTPKTYNCNASLLIKEDRKGRSTSVMGEINKVGLLTPTSDVNNELVCIQSPSIALEVVHRLHLDYTYSRKGMFHDFVIYGKKLPIEASIKDINDNQTASFSVELDGDNVALSNLYTSISGEEIVSKRSFSGKLGKPIQTPIGEITISPSVYRTGQEKTVINVSRCSYTSAMRAVSRNLSANLHDEEATVIDLSYNDVSVQRAEDILNTIISVYNENWVKDKNQIAISTNEFIDERIKVLEQDLGKVDSEISTYKSNNLLPNVETVGSMAMHEVSSGTTELRNLNNELYVVRSVRSYIQNLNDNSQLLPANTGIKNASISSLIDKYNTLALKRNSLVSNSSESHPLVLDTNRQLEELHLTIMNSLDQEIDNINSRITNLRTNLSTTTNKIAQNPVQAKQLLSVERQQTIKQSLYLFLLQKREENELSQAFTAYNTRVVAPPMSTGKPVSPKSTRILSIAFVIGLLLPLVLIYLLEVMNTRVRGRKDIEKLNVPKIGEIPLYGHRKKKKYMFWRKKVTHDGPMLVVKPKSRNIINEAFRVVRANLEFMTNSAEDEKKVIMFTSCNPGSGKTFISVNIATSLGVKEKKVVVVDLDLRRAAASEYVNKPSKGLTNYLNGQLDTCPIHKLEDRDGVDIIPVGTIPPNPTELLYSSRLKELMSKLRTEYDYVILDCPPVDIVADTSIITPFADMTVFIIRAELFDRDMLPTVQQFYDEGKLKNMAVLLNGTTTGHGRYGYNYGYTHYGYGYGYAYHSYGTDEE